MINSVWFVVDTVNKNGDFHVWYPSEYEWQQTIMDKFVAVIGVVFLRCAGYINSILIWIQIPSEDEAHDSWVGKRILCGSKTEFDLTC